MLVKSFHQDPTSLIITTFQEVHLPTILLPYLILPLHLFIFHPQSLRATWKNKTRGKGYYRATEVFSAIEGIIPAEEKGGKRKARNREDTRGIIKENRGTKEDKVKKDY